MQPLAKWSVSLFWEFAFFSKNSANCWNYCRLQLNSCDGLNLNFTLQKILSSRTSLPTGLALSHAKVEWLCELHRVYSSSECGIVAFSAVVVQHQLGVRRHPRGLDCPQPNLSFWSLAVGACAPDQSESTWQHTSQCVALLKKVCTVVCLIASVMWAFMTLTAVFAHWAMLTVSALALSYHLSLCSSLLICQAKFHANANAHEAACTLGKFSHTRKWWPAEKTNFMSTTTERRHSQANRF